MANLAGVCFITFALTVSAAAQTEQRRPSGPAVGPSQGGTMAPPGAQKPVGPTRPAGPVRATPLTEGECTTLGGTITTDLPPGVCNSGKACHTVDENKQVHNVCIAVK
jgi:hypothetical protein